MGKQACVARVSVSLGGGHQGTGLLSLLLVNWDNWRPCEVDAGNSNGLLFLRLGSKRFLFSHLFIDFFLSLPEVGSV